MDEKTQRTNINGRFRCFTITSSRFHLFSVSIKPTESSFTIWKLKSLDKKASQERELTNDL